MKINYKKAIIFGTIVILLQMVFGNLLYINPIAMEINKQFEGHPSIKSFDFIGGMGNWLLLTLVFSIFLMVLWIVLYTFLYKAIPGEGWKKGLFFGLALSFIKAVPEAFNQWMIFVYPSELIILQLVNTFLGLAVFGILLGFFYKKFNVINYEK